MDYTHFMLYKIELYTNVIGKTPYDEWLDSLDEDAFGKVAMRVERLGLGNLSNCQPVGDGVHEIKIYFGPAYRIYFSNIRFFYDIAIKWRN